MEASGTIDAPMTETITDTAQQEASIKFPINNENKSSILLNVEDGVKTLLTAIAKKEEIDGVEINAYSHLPNSITGVVMYFVAEGLKNEFDLGFTEPPISLRQRGSSKFDKKVAGKKRLLTREQKNQIIDKMKMSYYESDIANSKINIEEAMASIKAAFDEKRGFESMGYILPEAKTAYPHWIEEDETED